ncbi:hypothetical protein TrST_g2743 [Triparma strigata]|uniref:Uncharacterized protein n=1 Tax=Triparma strigata TaxID=1606541 RepID=A0A9W7AZX1_9STRA|nr:hypothetical protein TrST_g2743 [Triparma strigata]
MINELPTPVCPLSTPFSSNQIKKKTTTQYNLKTTSLPNTIGLIPDGNIRHLTGQRGGSLPSQTSPPQNPYSLGSSTMSKIITYLSSLRSANGDRVENIVIYALSHDNYIKRPSSTTKSVLFEVSKRCLEISSTHPTTSIKFIGDLTPLLSLPCASRSHPTLKTFDSLINYLNTTSPANPTQTLYILLNYSGKKSLNNYYLTSNNPLISSVLPLSISLIIRSGGECRLSDFCPLESRYAEIMAVNEMWPDVGEKVVGECIEEWGRRRKRRGG